ncbi:MAG: glycosyltransferase family 4 protein [Luteolibacter sp.]
MKVIQILPELNSGGVERGTLEIGAALVAAGHQSIVISNGGRLVKALEADGSRHIAMPVHRKKLSSLGQVGPMRQLLKELKPDIVHIRSRVPGWITWLAWRKMDPATRAHLVSTVHGFYSTSFYSAVMTKGERVIAVSKSIRDYILEHYPKTDPDLIRLVYRGIEPEQYRRGHQPDADWLARWQAEHPEFEGRILLLLPGRITRLKGHKDLFELIAALKAEGLPVQGLIAGDTHPQKKEYLAELKQRVAELGIEKEITFLGHRGDLREVMSVCHLVCALSQQPESFGRTVLEAMALGKPVVGYDCGGVGELLTELFPEGRVPLGDSAALLKASRAIIAGKLEPGTVGEPFTLRAMCDSTLAVYDELTR